MATQTQTRAYVSPEDKIKWGTRFAYAGGDVACNIVFGMIGAVLTIFYTDTAHISAAAIGYVMLGSRVFDGVSDVIMGIVVEKTHSRWGKARPWLLWMSIPFCVSAVLLFTVPKTDAQWIKILYVAITYNFCNTICYTAINLPYGTLSTYMTRSSHERDMLGNIRMGLSPLGKILGVTCTGFLVAAFDKDKGQDAWVKAMTIWAAVAFVLLILNFIFCKEKTNPDMEKANPKAKEAKDATAKKDKLPMKKALKFLVTNQYFWAVLLLWMFQSVSFGAVGTSLTYFCKWVIGDESLYQTLFLVETLTLVAGVFVCMPLVKKVGKRNLALFGAIVAVLGQALYCIYPENVGMLYGISIIRSIGLAPLNAVVFGMLGDVVDFGHYKNGVRQESFICAGGSVGTKLGSGLSSVVITQLLTAAGYNEGGEIQSPEALAMIKYIYMFVPLAIAVGVLLVLVFYKLDKKYDAMMLVLTKREWEKEESAHTEDIIAATKHKIDERKTDTTASAAAAPAIKVEEQPKVAETKVVSKPKATAKPKAAKKVSKVAKPKSKSKKSK
ncbi:MAG: MFS transporter [Bacilli bacterium]|nr:MFS transporter [Bacilli bacterium]